MRASPEGGLGEMSDYPVQIGKVQAPPLRDETLARDRLLDWLSIKIHRRVVLLVAEAGYGKTTLLADFSRRTRVRMLWFRLDRGDRDWVGFLAYLVAAVRIHVPDFGIATQGLLRETATSAPPLDTVLDTFLRELNGVPGEASALVFDDFHLVDDSPEVRHIIRELLARGPDRMSFVFASRREPPIRLARLRAQGEVAELHTDDLRFDATETERLFRDTYALKIEPAMLAELSRRTEGWAASLQLVRAALNDRDPAQVRAFISSLSGAEGHLYDYLAEEVIGDLPDDLQQFLMRTSLLDTVDLVLGPIAAGVSPEEARALINAAEYGGLLARGSQAGTLVGRAHPLVREFLQARLLRSIKRAGVVALHRAIALAAEPIDWQIATQNYIAAELVDDARRVLSKSIDLIVATGAFAAASDMAALLPSRELPGAAGLILRSRLAQQRAAAAEALLYAEEAWSQDPDSSIALLNLATARSLSGDISGAIQASRLLEQAGDPSFAHIARSYRLTFETSVFGSLDEAIGALEEVVASLRAGSGGHYLGVANLNIALLRIAQADPLRALANAEEAVRLLGSTSAGVEWTSALLARSEALAYSGDMDGAREGISQALQTGTGLRLEIANEVAQLEALLGDTARAWLHARPMDPESSADPDHEEQGDYALALLFAREGDLDAASNYASKLKLGQLRSTMAFEARRHLLIGLLAVGRHDQAGLAHVVSGTNIARAQGAWLWATYGEALQSLATIDQDPSQSVRDVARDLPVVLSMLAEVVLDRIADMDESSRAMLLEEARRRPWRWEQSTRRLLATGKPEARRAAAIVLSEIGNPSDIKRIRDAGRSLRDSGLARLAFELARRLAPRVFVEDLGKVRVVIGDRRVDGTEVRRKVLALLCLLLTRPHFASTREEVADHLWPDQDPASALNSLNQTVYFLRRVFEPEYREETSPMYVGQDGETIWLDGELIQSRSQRCRTMIKSVLGTSPPEGALALAREYTGRFALDFAYEEWSADYRDGLHASYLRVIESEVQRDLDSGHVARGLVLAERAAEIDPEAEELQAALIRLYRMSGAHAAAAEQYGHYTHLMHELGLEAPPLTEL
jgi:LuxR family maltose regulon positive regulatory protein